MEDLGFYLANYSAAECLSWGYQQGCAFVTSRCGLMRHDRSALVTSGSQCVSRASLTCAANRGRELKRFAHQLHNRMTQTLNSAGAER